MPADNRPPWLKKRLVMGDGVSSVKKVLREAGAGTVCETALCPNLNECFSRSRATFLIMGDRCTRSCGFCSSKKLAPMPLDPDEPHRVARAVESLGLRYVIVTSVTRDDVEDGGARHFAEVIAALRRVSADSVIEVLVPDFQGSIPSMRTVVGAGPDVIGHNIETVRRLYPTVRGSADYATSMSLLRIARQIAPQKLTKSALMLGLGESDDEIIETIADMRSAGCDLLTIGQYLRPTQDNLPVTKYYEPDEFEAIRRKALGLGFRAVMAGPFVRSSYFAEDQYREASNGRRSVTAPC